MNISFFKYQGTGNDFVMVDNRAKFLSKNNTNLVKKLCDRKFGIGADGLILLEDAEDRGAHFRMVYFNSDGRESSMCGNGGRCIVAFARDLGIIDKQAKFTAVDGWHAATIEGDRVSLGMGEVAIVEKEGDALFLNTGSPHHVLFADDIASIDVKQQGADIRYSEKYKLTGGTNVNFVTPDVLDGLKVRTYERGVEDETLSCGTGVTAAAIAAFVAGKIQSTTVPIKTLGGELTVSFKEKEGRFSDIWLTGPAQQVFKGTIQC